MHNIVRTYVALLSRPEFMDHTHASIVEAYSDSMRFIREAAGDDMDKIWALGAGMMHCIPHIETDDPQLAKHALLDGAKRLLRQSQPAESS